jgi:ACS family tartrate transporter-like MFS transporter
MAAFPDRHRASLISSGEPGHSCRKEENVDGALEKSAMRKIYLRLLPFAFVAYSLCYIDRINATFAGLTMRGDLDMSASVYGFAVGTFYWGYFLFEVPSNLIMEKVGARLWIARIMITWGALAALTAWSTGATSFAVIRFLLGVAEAGFFPGMVLYFTYWFPAHHHARIVSGLLAGFVVAVAGGAPISTALLSLDGMFNLRGWQIMYIAEGIPTIIAGIATLFIMTDKPEQAKFLTAEEKAWLTAKLASERQAKEAVRTFNLWQGLFNSKVLLLALNYFGILTASLGMLFFIPQIIKSLGVTNNMTVGWLTMLPYICGGISLIVWGRISDRMKERRWNLLAACIVSTVGLIVAGMAMGSWWALVGMSIAAIGFYGSKGPFWAMPPMFLTGTAAAASLAWINSIGNLGGFFGPWYVGVMKDLTGSFAGGLFGLALLGLIAATVAAFCLHIPDATKDVHTAPARSQAA